MNKVIQLYQEDLYGDDEIGHIYVQCEHSCINCEVKTFTHLGYVSLDIHDYPYSFSYGIKTVRVNEPNTLPIKLEPEEIRTFVGTEPKSD